MRGPYNVPSPKYPRSGTYGVRVHCSNCGWGGIKEFPRGERVGGSCPYCGVSGSLRRVP